MQKIPNSKFPARGEAHHRRQISNSMVGYTLLEVLLYISIFAIVGGLLVNILVGSLRINTESQSTRVVSEEGRFVVETIKRLVRESSLINMATTTSQGTLVLRLNDYTDNRDFVHVYASGTKIYMAEGVIGNNGASSTCPSTSSPICTLDALTDDKVSADSLSFHRVSSAPGNDTLQVDFTLSYVSSNPQSVFSKAFQTAIGRVSAAVFDSSLLPNPGSSLSVGVSGQKWVDGFFSGNLNIDGSILAGATNWFKIDSTLNRVGIGTTAPTKPLQVSTGDVYVSQSGSGVILKSPDGTKCSRITIDNNGQLATSSPTIACP